MARCGPPFAQLNLGSTVAAAVTCCRLSISCSGWLDGSEAADVAVVAIDPELEMEPQCEKKDIWVEQGEIFNCLPLIWGACKRPIYTLEKWNTILLWSVPG